MKALAVCFPVSRAGFWLGAGLLFSMLISPAWSAVTCSCGCGGTPRPACAHSCGGTPCTGASSHADKAAVPVSDGIQSAAPAGCKCGCGGTPRPACAHTCGGTACTGGALKDSRMIIGEVVAGQPATFSVVGPKGGALTGFVVEFSDGNKVTTDEHGRAAFVPGSAKKLTATIASVTSTGVAVLDSRKLAESRRAIPRFAQRGAEYTMSLPGMFDGNAANTTVSVGGKPCAVLAESPRQAIVQLPSEVPVGEQPLHVADGNQTADGEVMTYDLAMSADKLDLLKGEITRGRLIVTPAPAADSGGVVRIQNLSPGTITLTVVGGQSAGTLTTVPVSASRIHDGMLEVPFVVQAKRGGSFTITGLLSDPTTQGSARCSCGCGNTPRPACAHTCGGNPCTGG